MSLQSLNPDVPDSPLPIDKIMAPRSRNGVEVAFGISQGLVAHFSVQTRPLISEKHSETFLSYRSNRIRRATHLGCISRRKVVASTAGGEARSKDQLLLLFDPTVYVVTGDSMTKGRPLVDVVEAALAGGARVVQYRNKSKSAGRDAEASELCKLTRAMDAIFIVNDDAELAVRIGADGVHIGQTDTSVDKARSVVGEDRLIGVSTKTVEQAEQAISEGADYLGVGPVYRTGTKSDAGEPLGLGKLMEIVRAVNRRVPVVGIGGIKEGNCGGCAAVGADGAAAISTIMSADDPREMVRKLRIRFEDGRPHASVTANQKMSL